MVVQSWFWNLLPLNKSESNPSQELMGVLAFEASGLMIKLLHLWQSLSDRHVARLRQDITKSVGIKKLVSEDDDYIAGLMCAEVTENLALVAKDVGRMSKKCNSLVLRNFELAFSDLVKIGDDPFGWQLPWKKMEKEVKKLKQFVSMNTRLYQEMEVLADIEQTYRRIKISNCTDIMRLVEYEKRLNGKRQVVKQLKEKSLWNRSYDYAVLLLARSAFSVFGRIGHVFGVHNVPVTRSSISINVTQSSVFPFENSVAKDSSTPLGRPISMSGPLSGMMNGVSFLSGPLKKMEATSNSPGKYSFYSRSLKKLALKSGSISRGRKSRFQLWRVQDLQTSDQLATADLSEAMNGTQDSVLKAGLHGALDHGDSFVVASKSKILNPPQGTLGAAALALHYANLIIYIEKLIASPHLVGQDARRDLYNMLTSHIRTALSSKLKPYAKSLDTSVHDNSLTAEWNEAIKKILQWLSPLAHNMIQWQSERSIEHQNSGRRTNVLLVQTLYFANQEKTEAVITELLVGLNYIWRFGDKLLQYR